MHTRYYVPTMYSALTIFRITVPHADLEHGPPWTARPALLPPAARRIMALVVHIVQGWDLMAQDTSTSDPYVVLRDFHTLKEIGRTEVKSGTLRPVWLSSFDVPDSTTCLLADVFDRDTLSADDAMGSARIPLPREVSAEHDQAEQDAWYKLTRGPPGFKGALRVQFTMKDVRSSSDGGAPPKPPSAAEGAPAAPFTTTSRRRTSVPTAAYLAHSPEFQQMFGSFGAMREFPKMEEMMFDIPLVKRGGEDESALITGRLLFTSHRIAFLQSPFQSC